jgi:hypothetical protein
VVKGEYNACQFFKERGIRTGKQAQEKGVGNTANPCLYIVVDITVEYNQEVRLKLSKK